MVLFIDTDPGTDDVMALIHLLRDSPEEIVGLSSVSGNLDIDVTTLNLRLIASCFNKERQTKVPVFKGASNPLVKLTNINASKYHHNDGCGGFFSSNYYKKNKNEIDELVNSVQLSELPAVTGLIELSKKYLGKMTIITLGPLTNVALAQIIDPEFGSRIKEIMIMGGEIYGHGNSDNEVASEFNFSLDPEAAYVVLKEMNCKKTILPLEPNFSVSFNKEIAEKWIKQLEEKDDIISNVMSCVIYFHQNKYPSIELYDLMLAMCYTDPKTISDNTEESAVIELQGKYTRGKLVIDYNNKSEKHIFQPFRKVNIIKTLNRESIFEKLEKLFI